MDFVFEIVSCFSIAISLVVLATAIYVLYKAKDYSQGNSVRTIQEELAALSKRNFAYKPDIQSLESRLALCNKALEAQGKLLVVYGNKTKQLEAIVKHSMLR